MLNLLQKRNPMTGNKTFVFNGVEFQTHKNVLRIMRASKPLLKKFQKYVKELTAGIDISNAEKDKLEIEINKITLQKSKEYYEQIKDGTNKNEIERVTKRISEQETEIKTLEDKFKSNEDYTANYKLYNEAVSEAFGNLVIDDEIMIPFLDTYLIGDKTKLDYENPKIIKFITEVLTDFFLLQSRNPLNVQD